MAFQNPAQNFAEQQLNLGDLVTLSPHSTFLIRSDTDYPDAGIMQGSILAIDRASYLSTGISLWQRWRES